MRHEQLRPKPLQHLGCPITPPKLARPQPQLQKQMAAEGLSARVLQLGRHRAHRPPRRFQQLRRPARYVRGAGNPARKNRLIIVVGNTPKRGA